MIEIALCTDNNYVMPAGVMIYSVCKHNSNVSFNVIVPEEFFLQNMKRLEAVTNSFGARIRFHFINKEMTDGFPVHVEGQPMHISIAAYYRLFLGKILPDEIKKVIYLDCDVICLSNLKELWDIDLCDAPIACVNEILRPWQNPHQRLNYAETFPYFNSGVLLINLDYWRKNDVLKKFFNLVRTSPEKLQFHDQDVLNYVFHEQALLLPPKFNATDIFFHKEFLNEKFPFSEAEVYDARYNPVIVHFTYKNKPWIKGGSHTYRNIFLSYKKETPWKNQRLKVKKATNFKGIVANILVYFGLYQYHDDYIPLN